MKSHGEPRREGGFLSCGESVLVDEGPQGCSRNPRSGKRRDFRRFEARPRKAGDLHRS